MPGTNTIIGRYVIESQLGRGGSGAVYRAFDPTMDRLVAVKLLHHTDSPALARFRAEAAAAGKLKHRNIVTVYEFGEYKGQSYLITELLEGETLREVILRNTAGLLDKLDWMSQIADALAYAHESGLVHRDVKPANIFVQSDGTAKLMDFGIARLQSDSGGELAGTPSYMSPEQFMGTEDHLSDIWSYGVVFYELLTGKNPFSADTVRETINRIVQAEPPPLRSLAPDSPEPLEALIHRALAKDRELRYHSARELLLDLQPVLLDLRQDRAAQLLEQVKEFQANNDLDAAKNLLRQALELNPSSTEARKIRETVELNLRRETLRPRIDSLLSAADTSLANRMYSEAIEALESAQRLDSSDADIARRLDQARNLLERSIHSAKLLASAQKAGKSGDLKTALRYVSEALHADPENQDAKVLVTDLQGRIESRAALLQRSNDELTAARRLAESGAWNEAEQRLAAFLGENPGDSNATELLHYVRARKAEEKRRELIAEIAARASKHLDDRQFSKALSVLDAGLGQFGGLPELLQLKESADRAFQAEQRAEALAFARAQIENLRNQGSLDEALNLLDQAVREFGETPDLSAVRSSLQRSLRERDLLAQARNALEGDDAEGALRMLESGRLESLETPEILALVEKARLAAAEQGRRQSLNRKLARSRELEQARDPEGALRIAEEARSEFPDEPGLKELSDSLREQVAAAAVPPKPVDSAPPAAGSVTVSSEFTRIFPSPLEGEPKEFSLLITESPNPAAVNRITRIKVFPFATGSRDPDLAADPRLAQEHIVIERAGSRFFMRARAPGVYLEGREAAVGEPQPLLFNARIRLTSSTHAVFEPQAGEELPDLLDILIAGRYRIVKRLHSSSSAAVYRAEDEHLPRSVALKILSPRLAGMEAYVEQFQNEARIAARLRHPNICRVLDYGVTTVTLAAGSLIRIVYICMELMEGGSLRSRLEAFSTISPETLTGWIKTVAAAVDYAHRNQVIHSGLKPSSVVFDTDGNPYLTDFAIATQAGSTGIPAVIGAPAFLAPEQWRCEAATPATDQFALAVLAYYLVAGTKPFDGQDDPEVRRKNFSREPVPAHILAAQAGHPGVPPGVSAVLAKGLSVNPGDRYRSAPEFADAFAGAYAEPAPVIAAKAKPKVFFSYCRDLSGGWATLFSIEMERKGISVFIDVGRQDSAVQFPERLKFEIQKCDVFLCFIAGGTFRSTWVDTEVKIAFESGRPMLPILQESFQRNDLQNPAEHIQTLLNYNGIRLVDQYVKAAITEAIRVIRQTAKGSVRRTSP